MISPKERILQIIASAAEILVVGQLVEHLAPPEIKPALPIIAGGLYVLAAVADYKTSIMAREKPHTFDGDILLPPDAKSGDYLSPIQLLRRASIFVCCVLVPTYGIGVAAVTFLAAFDNFRLARRK